MSINLDAASIGAMLIQASISYLFGVIGGIATDLIIRELSHRTDKGARKIRVDWLNKYFSHDFFKWLSAPLALVLSFGVIAILNGTLWAVPEVSIVAGVVVGILWQR